MGRRRTRKTSSTSSESNEFRSPPPKRKKRRKPAEQHDKAWSPTPETSLPHTIKDSLSERCGKVASMRLQNFMCHENLLIEFGPNINFLVGSNGSGKSAVLTALVLGLGSSARATHRASSIQKLIKNGETSATIEVTLCNSGLRPYRPEFYGPRVTIVRQIRLSSSNYQVKDARGNIVSRKLDDIRRILVFFGIQVDNPIFVLNQDTARQFLKDLDPATNYALVMKGTQLDLCCNSLNQIYEKRINLTFEIELLKDRKEQTEMLVNEEEEKLKMLQNKESIKALLGQSKLELAWLAVKQHEKELTGCLAKIKAIEVKKAELIESTSKKECKQQAFSQQLSKLEETKAQILELYGQQERTIKNAKLRVQEINERVCEININIKNAERRLQEDQKLLDSCQKHLENYNVDYAKNKRLKENHSAKLAALNKSMKANEETIRQLRKEQEELTNKAFEAQEQAEHSRNEVRRLEKKDIHLRAEIHSLNTNKSNKTCVFGQQAMQAHDFIRREFNSDDHINLPRGPIAKYISVPNPQYRDLIEHELTHSLRSFIVNSDEDRRKLRSIFERVYTTGHLPSIISSPFSDHVYDVSPYKVKKIENTSVLIDEIKCDDPIVMNFLIDWCRIETVLITESKETAEYLTSDSENVPPNLTRVLVPNLYLEYIPAPHYSMYSLNLLSARLLQVDINDRIRLLEKDTVDLKRSLLNAQIVFQKTNGLTINFKKEIKAKAPVIEQLSNENIKALEEIMEIEQYEYEELPEQDHLQKTMDSIRAKMSETERQHRLLLADLSEINEQKAQAEKQEAEERAKIIPIQENIESIEKESLDIESKIRSLDTHYEANFVKLNKTIELHENFLKQKADVERDLKETRDKAQKRGDCCEIENTEQEIRDKICHYKAKIKQFENYNGSVEKVQQKLNQLRTKLQSQTENLQLAREAAKKLRISYHQRAQRYQRCRFHFFSMVDFQFQQALSLREFKSNVIIDHGANTMQIDVEPPSGNKTSNSKTLSGGERSFTTVSLLKGLWSTSDHPFYFLDEYDVFTDEINRSFITQILIDEGNDYQNRQFCFLTPQDTEVAASPLIKVHKLEPPVV